jgi:uncharacterized membrane protein
MIKNKNKLTDNRKQKLLHLLFWGLFVFFMVLYTTQVVLNHYFMRTYALDYGFYNQAFWDFAHFRTNSNTVFDPPLGNYFQIHPAFTLPLLSPLYWIFNPFFGTYSLLIIQNIFIMLGGYGTYLLIKRKTGNEIIAILAFIHFNVIWGHFSALASDYIDTTVAASMVPLFFLYFDKKKYVLASLIFLFVIICKENMPIWFIFISITLIWLYRDRVARWVAVGYSVFSLVYLVFLFKVLIPHFQNPDLPYWGFAYSALGKNPAEAIVHIFKQPWDTIRLLYINQSGDPLYDGIKQEFYKVFLLSGGVLLIVRPVYFIPFIPIIAQKVLNDYYVRWGIMGFYSIEVVSILTLAVFLATAHIKSVILKYALYVILCFVSLRVTLIKMDERVSRWYDAGKENLTVKTFYTSPNDVRHIRKLIQENVPSDANVAAMQDIVPHLAYRKNISIFPFVRQAEYIIFIMNGNKYPLNEKEFIRDSDKYINDNHWQKIVDEYPLLILKRR